MKIKMKNIKTFNDFVNESKINESGPTKGTMIDFNLKNFQMFFGREYSYISHNIKDKDIQKFIDDNKKDRHGKTRTLSSVADQFQDYLVSQGLADVQESNIKEGLGIFKSESDLIKKYPNGARLIKNLNSSVFEDWYKLYDKYIEGDIREEELKELYEDSEDIIKIINRK